jgi:hypothetical protein
VVVLAFCFLNAAQVGAVQVLGPSVADHSVGRRVWGLVLAANTAGMLVGELARVYSYDALGSFLAIPLGEVAAGPAANAFGTPPALLGAAGIVGLSAAGTLLSRQVRTLEHRPARPEPDPVGVPG